LDALLDVLCLLLKRLTRVLKQLLILGWLFGLLSPAILEAIRKRREAKEIKFALQAEIQELQYHLVHTICLIEVLYGKADRQLFEWARSATKHYRSVNSSEILLKLAHEQPSFTEEKFEQILCSLKNQPRNGLSIKKLSTPLLDSRLTSLVWFNKKLRSQFLEMKNRIGIINELVDESRAFFNLTFQSNIHPGNYENANENLARTYRQYAAQARAIVNLIREIK